MDDSPLQSALRAIALGRALTRTECASAFRVLMAGQAPPAQSAALLFGLRARGETADEVAGAADALRAAMIPVHVDAPGELVDTCGTGGGAVTTLNLSTAAAFVVAGAGVRVAKHGNRSYTSRSGSADVLEALGVDIDLDAPAARRVLAAAGIAFLFAPAFHPAMRHVAPTRRELAVPTVMNLLGPLVNPAGASRQVVGVADANRGMLLAEALLALGSVHALVVHADVGMDEVSPVGPTAVWEVAGGAVRRWDLDPSDLGVTAGSLDGLAGGTPEENAGRILAVLDGKGSAIERDAILLNAAAGILVSGKADSMRGAMAAARESLRSGAARASLQRLRAASPRNTSG